VRSRR